MKRSTSVGLNLTAGVETLVYRVPVGYTAEWELAYFHNTTTSAKNITLQWHDDSANININILDNYPSPGKEYFKFDGGARVVLDENDEVRVTTEAASSFSIVCTFILERKQ